jgi:hypothetical protein
VHLVGFIYDDYAMRTLYLVEICTWKFVGMYVISFDMHCRCEREGARNLRKFKLACAGQMNVLCSYSGQPQTE